MAATGSISGVFTSGDWNQAAGDWTVSPGGTRATMGTTGTALLIGLVDTWDMTGSSWAVKFHAMPTAGTGHGMELRSLNANTNMLRLFRSAETGGGVWTFRRTIASANTDIGTINQTHLDSNPFVRFREASGTLYLDTSADGSTWNNQLSGAASTLPLTTFRQRFQISSAVTGNWVLQQMNGTAAPGTVTTGVASSVVSAGTWTNGANTYTSNDTYATNTGATQNTEYPLDIGGFDFSAITSGATINAVKVTIEAKTGTASRAQIKGEAYDGSTLLTGALALTNLTAADANYSFTPTATRAQLQSANFKIRVTNKRIVSQASTTSVDFVTVVVEWTAAGGTTHEAGGTLGVTSATASAPVAVHEAVGARASTAGLIAAGDVVTSTPKTDTATSNFADTAQWTVNFGTGTSSDVTLPAIVGGSSTYSVGDYDLLGSSIFFKIDQLHTQSSTDVQTSFYLRVAGSNANMVRFLITSTTTTVYMRYYVASAMTQAGSYTWSASRPWLKISEAAGVVTWWDSADGVSWTSKATWTHASAINLADLELSFQALDGAGGVSGSTIISHVNVPGSTTHEAGGTLAGTVGVTSAAVALHEALAPRPVTASLASVGAVTEAVWAADSALAVTAGRAAAATITREATGARATTAGLTAAATVTEAVHEAVGALAATAGRAASASITREALAALPVTSGLVAAATTTTAAQEASAPLAITATLTAAAAVVDAVWAADSALAVTAGRSATAAAVHPAAAPVAINAALTASASIARAATGTRSATAALSASVLATHEATAPLAAVAYFTAVGATDDASLEASAILQVATTLTAAATVTDAVWAAVATLPVTAVLAAAPVAVHESAGPRANVAALTSATDVTRPASAPFAASSALVASVGAIHEAVATLGVTAGRTAATTATHEALAVRSSTAGVTAGVFVARNSDAVRMVQAGFGAAGTVIHNATASLVASAVGTSLGEKLGSHEAVGTLPVTAGRTAAAVAIHPAAGALAATAGRAAAGQRATPGTAVAPITAGLTASAETFSTAVAGGARGGTAGLVAAALVVRAAEAVLHETMMSLATGGRATAAEGTLPIVSGSRASASAIVLDVESVWDVIVGDRDLNITSPSGGLATTIKQRELSVTVGARETS